DSPFAWQGRTLYAPDRAVRRHYRAADPWRTTPSICTNLSSRKPQGLRSRRPDERTTYLPRPRATTPSAWGTFEFIVGFLGVLRTQEVTHAIHAHRSELSSGNVARLSRQPSHSNAVVRGHY